MSERKNQGVWWTVERVENRYCAELWRNPYNGQLLAETRVVKTRSQATLEGEAIFGAAGFKRHPSQVDEAL